MCSGWEMLVKIAIFTWNEKLPQLLPSLNKHGKPEGEYIYAFSKEKDDDSIVRTLVHLCITASSTALG